MRARGPTPCFNPPLSLSLWREEDSRFSPSNIPWTIIIRGMVTMKFERPRLVCHVFWRLECAAQSSRITERCNNLAVISGWIPGVRECTRRRSSGTRACPPKLTDYRFIVYLDETRRGVDKWNKS